MAKVGLYCGHGVSTDGSWDAGCTYQGETEANLMLPITRAAVKYLRAAGVTVYTDANNEINMIMQVSQANRLDVDVFVSVHCDYYRAPSGVMPLYVSGSGKNLANCLRNAVMSGVGIGSRGAIYRTDLYELNSTNAVACILETGSISADLSTFKNKYDEYGRSIAKGICDYLGIAFNAAPPKTTSETISLYRVQTGAFNEKANAEKLLKNLQSKGYKGFIVQADKLYKVQAGAFKEKSNAQKFADGLKAKGFACFITGGDKVAHNSIAEDGMFGYASCVSLQRWLGSKYSDGELSGQLENCKEYIRNFDYCVSYNGGGSYTVELLQRKVGAPIDGYMGKTTVKFLQSFLNKNGYKLDVDGIAGYNTCKAFQNYLNKQL